MLRRRTLIKGLLATVATPALAQNSFLTPGGSSVPGIVTMCLSSNVAVPCATGGGGSFPPNISGTQATIAADFAGQQYWASAASQASFAAWMTAIGGTYTRASSATYLQGGVVKTAAANAPRFPTDAGGVAQGIRLTGAGTNLATQSQTFTGSNWVVQGATLTNNTGPAPDGTNTASTLAITANLGNNLNYPYTSTVSLPYNGSFWVQGTPGQQVFFSADTSGPPANAVLITFDGSWQRVSANATGTGAGAFFGFEIFNRSGGAALPNVTFNVWGAQLTQSAFLLDYIPTTTATVTQAADSLTLPFTQRTFSGLAGSNGIAFDGTATQRILGDNNNAGIYIPAATQFSAHNGSASLAGPTITNVSNAHKAMIAGNASNTWVTSDGITPTTSAIAVNAAAPTTLGLGSQGGTANFAGGNYSQFAVWNAIVASTADMQRLTT